MKKLFFGFLLLAATGAKAQLLVNVQIPPYGVLQKQQLWSMAVTNTAGSSIQVHVELMLSDATTGQQVMSGVTDVVTILPGTAMLNATSFAAIQYNVLSTAYAIDASPNGLMPMGNFNICYIFQKHVSDYVEGIAEHCQEVLIEPLGPPQLIYPYDQAEIPEYNPQFSWLPPMPSHLFTSLNYTLDLVEIQEMQTASDAMQSNPPLYTQQNIVNTINPYPQGATALELNKNYAWRITVKSGELVVAQSDTWQFRIKQFGQASSSQVNALPYARLRRQDDGGSAIFTGELKFEYLNETSDTVWQLAVYDLSTADRRNINLVMDSIPLKRGQNLVNYPVQDHPDFIDEHLYLIEVINGRKEIWRLRFEYREPKTALY